MNPKTKQLRSLEKRMAECSVCPALTRTKTVFDRDGNPDAELVFIGQAPGKGEDENGVPFFSSKGSAGQFLNDEILKLMSLERKDVFVCNIVGCLPPREGDRDKPPSGDEAKNCRKFLDETLAIIKPKFICCLGTFASQKLLGTSKPLQTKQGKNVLQGKVHDHKGISVVCTYHPSSGKKKEILEDIRWLMKKMGK